MHPGIKPEKGSDAAKVVDTPAAPPDEVEIPPNLFSGETKELEVFGKNGSATDPLPGFRLYWFNDTQGSGVRISQAKRSGYEFVTNDEVLLNDSKVSGSDDLGTNVRKIVGQAGDKPLYAYLMKKPLWLHEKHQAEHEKVHQRQEQALRQGRVSDKRDDRQYAPGQVPGSNLPPIELDTKNYR
jgi:hypothetical protein